MFYVYLHRRNDSGAIFYVGKGCKRRAWSMSDRGDHWKRIVKKHGYSVELYRDDMLETDAYNLEKKLIGILRMFGNLCNICDGGLGGTIGHKHNDETKALISATHKGRKKSPEHVEKIKLANAKMTDEQKLSFNFAAKHKTPEHRNNISKSMSGKVLPEQTKIKLGNALRGVKKTRNTSGYVGVTLHKPSQKWSAEIWNRGKKNYLGLYDTAEQASAVYQSKKLKIEGV